jgi:hypothetical protein
VASRTGIACNGTRYTEVASLTMPAAVKVRGCTNWQLRNAIGSRSVRPLRLTSRMPLVSRIAGGHGTRCPLLAKVPVLGLPQQSSGLQVWGNECHLRLNLRQPIFLQHGARGSHATSCPYSCQASNSFIVCFSSTEDSPSFPTEIFPRRIVVGLGRRPCSPLRATSRLDHCRLVFYRERLTSWKSPEMYLY